MLMEGSTATCTGEGFGRFAEGEALSGEESLVASWSVSGPEPVRSIMPEVERMIGDEGTGLLA